MTSITNTPVVPPPSPGEHWPQILRYPFQPEALSTIVVLAILHGAVNLLPGILAGFFDLFVWAAFFRYGFEVLRWTANGRDKAPEIALTVSDVIGGYAVLLLIVIQAIIALTAAWYSLVAATIIGLLVTFAMPAMMVILALEEGVLRALNPIAWLMIAERLGRTYFVLVGFFFAAVVVQSVFALVIGKLLPPMLVTPILYLLVNYLLLANFHMIGAAIYADRDALGYTGHLELSDEVPYTDPARMILDAARSRAASGDFRGAATLLREELVAHPQLLSLHDEYRHWLKQAEENAELVAHGKTVIPVLLAQNHLHRAMDVARECLALDAGFALPDPAAVTQLAHAAAEAGQTQTALGLLVGFHKRFRNHPDIARNYLLAARLWAERMNKEMQARALLQQIKVMLPDDPAIPKVDAYLAFLDKLASTPTKAGSGPTSSGPASS